LLAKCQKLLDLDLYPEALFKAIEEKMKDQNKTKKAPLFA
jgi:hypothetical protein